MFKVTYQIHGAVDVRGKVFNTYHAARMWSDAHSDIFSFSFIQETFH
jgi:hypothetical protein